MSIRDAFGHMKKTHCSSGLHEPSVTLENGSEKVTTINADVPAHCVHQRAHLRECGVLHDERGQRHYRIGRVERKCRRRRDEKREDILHRGIISICDTLRMSGTHRTALALLAQRLPYTDGKLVVAQNCGELGKPPLLRDSATTPT